MDTWTCPLCTFVESVHRPGCSMCGAERPEEADPSNCASAQRPKRRRRRRRRRRENSALESSTATENEHPHDPDDQVAAEMEELPERTARRHRRREDRRSARKVRCEAEACGDRPDQDAAEKTCPRCSLLNAPLERRCAVCGFEFQVCEGAGCDPEPPPAAPEEPCWECPACLFQNAISVFSCAACEAVAPEWVEDMAKHQEMNPQALSRETERHVTEMQKLFEIDDQDIVENEEDFECPICFGDTEPGEGVRLRGCLHDICKGCLTQAVEAEESGFLRCGVCNFEIEDRDVIHVVSPQLWERRLQRVARQTGTKLKDVQHCRRPDCEGFAEVIGGEDFTCPVCDGVTCLLCKAFHPDQDCRQYQAFLNRDADALKSQEMLEGLLRNGLAMRCSGCEMVVQKDYGCDFLHCANCRMHLCWPTRGPRWGPGGEGDTSGGCRCGVGGRKCHPDCNNCH